LAIDKSIGELYSNFIRRKTAMQFTVQYDIPESIVETLQQHWPMIAEKI